MNRLSHGWQRLAAVLVIGMALAFAAPAGAANVSGALVGSADCTANQLQRNDDSYTSRIALPFSIDFWGKTYDQTWVNNNGNVTFDSPLATYTPFALTAPTQAIIAPFFADVDTRGGGETVKYGWGETTFEGRRAFCANWVNVGYYSYHYDKLNPSSCCSSTARTYAAATSTSSTTTARSTGRRATRAAARAASAGRPRASASPTATAPPSTPTR